MIKSIALLTPPTISHRTAEESIGIGYLAAVLRRSGYYVEIIDAWLCGFTIDDIIRQVCNLDQLVAVGISAYVSSVGEVNDIIRKLHEAGVVVPVIAGGFGPSFHPDAFFKAGCTYVVKGEAEDVILPLIESIVANEKPDIAGVLYKDCDPRTSDTTRRISISDLDKLPFPARDTIEYAIKRKNPIHIVTSRGCEASCLFCSIRSFTRLMPHVPRWRERSMSNIIDELQFLYEMYGTDCFKIVDDSFIEEPRDERWAEKFACEIARRNMSIRFRTQIRADRTTSQLTAALTNAGWFATSVGVENGSPSALRRMNKQATLSDNLRAIEILTAHGVYIQMGMILFDKDTTLHELWENFDFLNPLSWPVTKGVFTEMYAAEGTPLTKKLLRDEAVTHSTVGNYRYAIADSQVALIYSALRQWHKSHSSLYDRTHNPISAPKVLSNEGYVQYHQLCMRLYRLDVDFFKKVLDMVSGGTHQEKVNALVNVEIDRTRSNFVDIHKRVQQLDRDYGLEYDADDNLFLND